MGAPLSKNQIRKLGERLRTSGQPEDADLQLLYGLLEAYHEALTATVDTITENLRIPASRRLKTTGTIVDKLRRNPTAHLANIQDLAGVRLVLDSFNRREQDALRDSVLALFAQDDRPPRVHDRRAEPVHGYRAVHVVVYQGSIPVEIQIRTSLQHEWAELFEKLADVYGRGIRYGEEPQMPTTSHDLAPELLRVRDAELAVRKANINLAQVLADGFDQIESVQPHVQESHQAQDFLKSMRATVAELSVELDNYSPSRIDE